ncbi:MAG: hypothetical protein HFJ57_01995 [Clostridia bacterium]|nr:hypothetical protein [Clostridia bacterium]
MFKDQIKALILNAKAKDGKKKIENIVVLIVILIITVIAINTIWNGDKKETKKEEIESSTGKQLATTSKTTTNQSDNSIESNLETILSNIDGVGKVKVLITYSQSSEVVAMYNENSKNSTVEEKDSGGGTRTTTQTDISKDIIYQEENGEKTPITQKVINPKIEGAIITSTGAGNGTVKNNIVQAVEAVTGLPTHKIQVFEMKKD